VTHGNTETQVNQRLAFSNSPPLDQRTRLMGCGCGSGIECPPSKHKDLSSNPNIATKERDRDRDTERRNILWQTLLSIYIITIFPLVTAKRTMVI
jgi:hypothetical protein